MSYADNNLIAGETVTYRGRLHWVLFVKPVLVSAVILVAVILLLDVSGLSTKISTGAAALAWLAGLILSVIPIIPAILTWKSAEFSVTNKRVILKVGFVQSKTEEMFLNKVESVGVDQNLVGRMLGYGDIVIRGTGGSLEPFHRVSSPLEFRRQVQEQIGRSFEPQSKPTSV
ncbi:MAG TPA: PH domain-containing protein [Terriglobia bacterium]